MTIMESIVTCLSFAFVALAVLCIIYKSIKFLVSLLVIALLFTGGTYLVEKGFVSIDEETTEVIEIEDDIIIEQPVVSFEEYADLSLEYADTVLIIIESANTAIENEDVELARTVIESVNIAREELEGIIEDINNSEHIAESDREMLVNTFEGYIDSLIRAGNFMHELLL